jgi:peptide/nickel transport system ATP-binding protein
MTHADVAQKAVVSVEDLHVRFVMRDATVAAVNGVSFSLEAGQVLGILGESGSGKSVTLRALMRLLPRARTRIEGRVRIAGHEITAMDEAALREVRGTEIAMIFQEPMIALDPVFTIGVQIAETIVRHEGASYHAANRRALELLEMVQIPSAARRLKAYPHELSGGMRQRVAIARAFAQEADILLMDEPFGALDAITRDEMNLELLRIWSESKKTVLFITHSIPESVFLGDRVIVMTPRPGKVAEILNIDLPHPRATAVRDGGKFIGYVKRIRERLGVR